MMIRMRPMAAFLAVAPFCSSLIAQTPHTVALTWTWSQGDGPVATGFNVKRGTTTGGPYAIIASLIGTTIQTYTDAGGTGNILTPGTTYYYVVTAVSGAAGSLPSPEAQAIIPTSGPGPDCDYRCFQCCRRTTRGFPGSFISIYRTNLTPVSDGWSNSIANGQLPTQLDGVSVSIGGKPAYIAQMIPTQINAQVPDIGVGPTQVVVTTPSGSSSAYTVDSQQYGPAFWQWPGSQPVATHADYTIAAKNGTFPGTTTVPAKPGEVITLWGTGFGPVAPSVPAGQVPGQYAGAMTTNPVTVSLNGTSVTVLGAALSTYPGDYQVTIQISASIPSGDYTLAATIGGVSTPTMLFTVRQ